MHSFVRSTDGSRSRPTGRPERWHAPADGRLPGWAPHGHGKLHDKNWTFTELTELLGRLVRQLGRIRDPAGLIPDKWKPLKFLLRIGEMVHRCRRALEAGRPGCPGGVQGAMPTVCPAVSPCGAPLTSAVFTIVTSVVRGHAGGAAHERVEGAVGLRARPGQRPDTPGLGTAMGDAVLGGVLAGVVQRPGERWTIDRPPRRRCRGPRSCAGSPLGPGRRWSRWSRSLGPAFPVWRQPPASVPVTGRTGSARPRTRNRVRQGPQCRRVRRDRSSGCGPDHPIARQRLRRSETSSPNMPTRPESA